jgi:hypothetical protein
MIDGEAVGIRNGEPNFRTRLGKHLSAYLLKRFLVEHPLLSAQLGFSAVREGVRFVLAERAIRSMKQPREPPK